MRVSGNANMKFRYSYGLLFLLGFYCCSNNPSNKTKQISEKQFGLFLENGPRQGLAYFDSVGTPYDYRYFTETITNDSTISINLEISLSKEYNDIRLHDSLMSKVFFLPRELTPDSQHSDHRMSKELYMFLGTGTDTPVSLNKILKPKEKCVMTFGVLTANKYTEPTTPYSTGLIISTKNSSTASLKFRLNNSLEIPCGQIVYVTNNKHNH